jgi:hypothetical protein
VGVCPQAFYLYKEMDFVDREIKADRDEVAAYMESLKPPMDPRKNIYS